MLTAAQDHKFHWQRSRAELAIAQSCLRDTSDISDAHRMAINRFPQIATVLPGSLGNFVVIIGDLVKVIGAVDRFGSDNRPHLTI